MSLILDTSNTEIVPFVGRRPKVSLYDELGMKLRNVLSNKVD